VSLTKLVQIHRHQQPHISQSPSDVVVRVSFQQKAS
jgi:hypothetical protein